MLNQRHRKVTITGSKRTDTTMTPGYCWNMDIAYMKRAKSGFKYILVMTESMTNYTSLLPLKKYTCKQHDFCCAAIPQYHAQAISDNY